MFILLVQDGKVSPAINIFILLLFVPVVLLSALFSFQLPALSDIIPNENFVTAESVTISISLLQPCSCLIPSTCSSTNSAGYGVISV